MKNLLPKITLILLFFLSINLKAQQKYTISGYFEDSASAEKLISAAIFDVKTSSGAVSNTYGFYSLTLPKGNVNLIMSYVGYADQRESFLLRKDTIINIRLRPNLELQAVEISARKQDRIEQRTQMSQVTIPIAQIKKIPALLGEVDVLKALQLLPGVQAGGEGQNGLYVRGGSPDQNLILLDGVPVYNVSHVGGFFSVFNGDAVKNVTLTKGGFPARYGGRLSSIIEIDMKEGNMKEFHGEGGIGLISSRLTLEGPIKKDVASYMISARRTYVDALLIPILKLAATNNANGNQNTTVSPRLNFYDINGKINWKINEKNRLYLSAYTGEDIFGYAATTATTDGLNVNTTDGGTNWGNITTAFRWNSVINNKLFANTTLTYSRYKVDILASNSILRNTVTTGNLAQYTSGIEDISGKVDFDYVPNPKNRIRFGLGATQHTYNPGAYQLEITSAAAKLDTVLGSTKTNSVEPFVYVEDEFQLGALKANIGLHASGFKVGNTFYQSIQPRVGLNYPLSNDLALKASFTTMRQYINLLTNERIGLPTDLWVPSTERIKPQDAWQAAIGAAKTVQDDYEVSAEVYYKKMTNVISYREGVSYLGSDNGWEDKITQGVGETYGLELFVQKKIGKFTGWVGYTLSWNTRQFDNEDPTLRVNNGKVYPFKYDRRNDFKVLCTYNFSEKFSFTSSWQFSTGNSVSLPEITYSAPQRPENVDNPFIGGGYRALEIIGDKNSYRMPSYHRLDVNFEWTKKKKRFTRTFSLGAYNAYSRANPVFLYRDSNVTTVNGQTVEAPVFRQFSLLPIVPSIAYNFKF
jgi:TonB-dependent Receptor Plug Domain/CarboxypepD_reg-like domain